MKRRVRGLSAVVGSIVLMTACSSGQHISAPTTTTSTAPNPDVIPAVITPAYVDAVFKELNHVNGDAVRSVLSNGSVAPAVSAKIRAVYGDPLYAIELRVFTAGLSQNTSNLRRPPGDRVTSVDSLISASQTCIFVRTTSDLSAVELRPTGIATDEYWVLRPKLARNDPEQLNPTLWSLTYNQDFQTPTSVPNQC